MLAAGRLALVLAFTLVPFAGCERQSEPPSSAGGPAGQASAPIATEPPPLASADRAFLLAAAETGFAEAEASHLVAERGADPAVRSFAERLLADHAETNDELGHLAAMKGVTLPAAAEAEQARWVARLRGLGGAALDRAFLRELDTSRPAAIALYEREAKAGADPELQAFAAKTLPRLREQQAIAQRLAAGRQS